MMMIMMMMINDDDDDDDDNDDDDDDDNDGNKDNDDCFVAMVRYSLLNFSLTPCFYLDIFFANVTAAAGKCQRVPGWLQNKTIQMSSFW
ncbi:hypothetical protein ElyMa_004358800 [Elysia marginata]|uniref:Uncharacterized protein n=1 Tax=Elysia marginata TaxID=1093978 RepID=A0AAV4H7H4_9GAST|nr:hypothetical protein ElyMa_004358800 [Elysia marginata]